MQVGFGVGPIHIIGANNDIPTFFLPRGTMESVFLFTRETIERRLSFDWFKQNYVCQDQPWICEVYG